MTDICSIWTYEEIKASGVVGNLQASILSIFAQKPIVPKTCSEIVHVLGFTVHETHAPRIKELTDMGFLVKFDKVRDKNSKKLVNRWIYTGRKKPYPKKFIRMCCPKCNGDGWIEKNVYIQDDIPQQVEEPQVEEPQVEEPQVEENKIQTKTKKTINSLMDYF